MDAELKRILKSVVLEMRHELEGYYDSTGKWFPGDLEQRLAEIGVRKDRESAPADELALSDEDVAARKVIDAYVSLRQQAGVDHADAVSEYIRESAYTWANRLVALRCMEARELLDDEVIVGREAYGGRSLVHHRLAQTSPELCTGEDDGRFAMLFAVFAERAESLPMLFDPESPSIALRPSPSALKNCLAWLSGTAKARSQDPATDAVFAAPDALGWAYQYWNTEEKDRVFETVRTKKGAKIEGADIIPATQLYTEDYMVKFLVQNSLGATWMGMHPESQLLEGWEYYVRDADRAPVKRKPLRQITLLDPACGSGHFLIEAFDMFFAMYEEEGEISEPEVICKSILENNLFGIDIDERAIQIAEASLWMKAEERAFSFSGANTNLVAATSSHLKGESWERYLAKLEKEPSTVRVLRRFAKEMEHIDELGSLARPAEALEAIIKKEHELWEEQERERREADKSLFKEIRDDLLASQLPFQDISDQEFFERTMRHALFAIDGFTAEARESGEFNDQLMGVEAKTGFRLLDLLSQRYDVVVANPPYMGAGSMGRTLKAFCETHYKPGKRDLYAAFILKSVELLNSSGKAALVTRQSWMFLRYFKSMRLGKDHDESETGILADSSIEVIAQLGPNAFAEISGEVVTVAMFVLAAAAHDPSHRITAMRLDHVAGPDGKAIALREVSTSSTNLEVHRTLQARFKTIPEAPIIFWLTEGLWELFNIGQRLEHYATAVEGLQTGQNHRWYRFFWEADVDAIGSRWVCALKGGGYRKWTGLDDNVVDWRRNGQLLGSLPGATLRNPSFYFTQGISYTDFASGCLGVRFMRGDEAFDLGAPCVFPFANAEQDVSVLAAVLNSRIASYLVRLLSPNPQHIRTGYLKLIPFPSQLDCKGISSLALKCKELKLRQESIDPESRNFQDLPSKYDPLERLKSDLQLLVIEAKLERMVSESYNLDEKTISVISKELGTPAGWFDLACNSYPLEQEAISAEISDYLRIDLSRHSETSVSEEVLERILSLYSGALSPADPDCGEDPDASICETDFGDEDESADAFAPIPPESVLEMICQATRLHPISVFAIVQSGIQNGLRNSREQRQFYSDQISVKSLWALGHRWPKCSARHGASGFLADDDGIVPLTDVAKEKTLQERVVARFNEDDVCTSDFTELMGKSIDDWLATDFFKHHIKQFKKRPIAWQLQTASFTVRKTPAFACLVYYHRVDVDTIAKIRTQYTGPLKLRFETETRGISSTPVANRTDNQAKRVVELEEAITELQAFDEKLATIAKSGFGPAKFLPKLRQYGFDDAMLAMKARWLNRLSELLNKPAADASLEIEPGSRPLAPIESWEDQANETGLHPELAAWIADALSHLDYFCSLVGPKAPEAKKTPEDPTATDFAELIRPETATMQTRSMEVACGVWWGKFDDAVLAPIKERIKQLKAEQKELNAEIKRRKAEGTKLKGDTTKDESGTSTDDGNSSFQLDASSASLKERLDEVKAKIRKFTSELNAKSAKAQAIRDSVQAWRSTEPDQWHDWLAKGPLFDQVSSLDERRTPPKTIAEFIAQESLYAPDINDGVRVNIAPLQKAGVLAADVLAAKDVDKAIADRAEWRSDERRWVREGKLPQCGWWKQGTVEGEEQENEGESDA